VRKLLPILVAVFVSAIGYGISFPLISIRVEHTGVDGWLIGVNAAMPALGWIVGSLLIPVLQLRVGVGIRALALGFLAIAAAAMVGLQYAGDYPSMTALRFFFGGGMGLFYRSVEYWINGISEDRLRARNLAVNGVAFMLGLVVGSVLQPNLGDAGWTAFGPVLASLGLAMVITRAWPTIAEPPPARVSPAFAFSYIAALPLAYIAVLAYGLDESVPASLAQFYALKNGLGPEIAAYTLTAAALGNILIPIPIALLSDRIGRTGPLVSSAIVAAAAAFAIPSVVGDPTRFLLLLLICAGASGTVYGLALAMIGDRYTGADLVGANAAFGIVYAAGSLVGPVVNGAALDTMQSHGLMVLSGSIFAVLTLIFAIRSLFIFVRGPA
jgi:MFS family permease